MNKLAAALLLGAGSIVDPTDAFTSDQIVLREDENFCVAHVLSSSDVELAACQGGNANQDWDFIPGGRWKTVSTPQLCATAPTSLPAPLKLAPCSVFPPPDNWDHEKYAMKTIHTVPPSPTVLSQVCIAYPASAPYIGDAVQADSCPASLGSTNAKKFEWSVTRFQMIVLDSDNNYCVGIKNSNVKKNEYLELQACNSMDTSQLFRLVEGGTLRPYKDLSLCVDAPSTSGKLRLQTCSSFKPTPGDQVWSTMSGGGSSTSVMLQNDGSKDCMRYGASTPVAGSFILTDPSCSVTSNRLQWVLMDKEDWSSSTSNNDHMLVLRTNTDYCIGLEGHHAVVGNRLELDDCDVLDKSFYWEYVSKQLKPVTHGSLCAQVKGRKEGEQVSLQPCSSTIAEQKFDYHTADEQFHLSVDNSVCLSFLGGTDSGKPIVLDECTKNCRQLWARTKKDRYPPEEYPCTIDGPPGDQMIVADDDPRFCITITSAGINGLLKIDDCHKDDDKQKWTLSSTGALYPKLNPGVCADVDSLSSGTDVYLKKCDVLNRKLWAYDTSTIRAGTSGLCMTYATSSLSISPNDVIELTPCASAATWKWYDENIYGHEISEKNHYDKVHIVSMKKDADTSIETCLSVLSPSLNAHVIYTDCHLNDQKQDWATNELGQLFLKDYTLYCVQVMSYANRAEVKLRYCDSSKQSQQFVFEPSNEITPVISTDLCLSSGTGRRLSGLRSLQYLRLPVTFERCNGSDIQRWKFDKNEGDNEH